MITSPLEIHSGYVRGVLSTKTLSRVLCGELSVEGGLTISGFAYRQPVHCTRLPSGTVVGFIAYPERPREIIVAKLPFSQQVVPAVSLSPARDDWKPNPQLISVSQLLRYEGVVLSASWLRYLVDLAATLRNPETHQFGVDKTLLTIGGVWERWEHGDLTWPQRCKDLVRLTGGKEQKPNTLMRKCERHGLVRRDKKGVPTSATTRC